MNNLSYEEKEILYRKMSIKKRSEFRVNWLDHKISDLSTGKTALIVDIPPYYTELTWMKVKFEDVYELVILTKSVGTEEKDRGFLYEGYYAGSDNKKGFGENKLHKNGTKYDDNGYDSDGFNKYGFDVEGYSIDGYGVNGYNKVKFNKRGLDPQGFGPSGINSRGFNKNGFYMDGSRYDPSGFDSDGFDSDGFTKEGLHQNGSNFDHNGYNRLGFNQWGVHRNGTNFDDNGFNIYGFDIDGFDIKGFSIITGLDRNGYDKNKIYLPGGYIDITTKEREEMDLENEVNKISEEQYFIDHTEDYINTGEPPEHSDFSISTEYSNTPVAMYLDEYDDVGQELLNKERRRGDDKKKENIPIMKYDEKGFQEIYIKEEAGQYEGNPYYNEYWYPTGLHKNGTYFDENGLAYGGQVFNEHGHNKDDYDARGFGFGGSIGEDGEYDLFYPLHRNGTRYDDEGFNYRGFDKEGFDIDGLHEETRLDRGGYNKAGFNKSGLHKNGSQFDEYEFNAQGIHKNGTTRDNAGYDCKGLDENEYYRRGFKTTCIIRNWEFPTPLHKNGTEYDYLGYDAEGFDRGGYDAEGFNKRGFTKSGVHKNSTKFDKAGYDMYGYNLQGFQDSGLHKNGTMYDENGLDALGKKRGENRVEEIGYDELHTKLKEENEDLPF